MTELLLQIAWLVVDFLLTAGMDLSFGARAQEDSPRSTATSQLVVAGMVGLGVGVLFGYIVPQRLLSPPPLPGLSLILVPALLGGAMHLWGIVRRRHGGQPSALATWYGGATVGVGLAAGRLFGMTLS
jgi:hypothetical protein